MKEITYYQAMDGEVFSTREACEEYEDYYTRGRLDLAAIEFLDNNGNVISQPRFEEKYYDTNMIDIYNNAHRIRILSNLTDRAKDYAYNVLGIVIPDKKGTYEYDWKDCKWVNVS